MERRNNNRREGGKKTGRQDFRREDSRKPRSQKRSGGRFNDADDFDRKESRRRKAISEENWFDLNPGESNNYQYEDDSAPRFGRDSRQRKNDRDRDGFRKKGFSRGGRNYDEGEDNGYSSRRRRFDQEHDEFAGDDRPKRRFRDNDDKRHSVRDNRDGGSFRGKDKFSDRKPNKRDSYDDYDNDDTRSVKRQSKDDGGVRLNKYIANAGICSRREADVLIASGAVSVNGEVITQMGYKVMPGDVVHYGGTKLVTERKRYILLNKPKGYITTMDDPQERRTVMSLIDGACSERVYPVGRLDRNTTGLLLFTNDGELAKKLTHPSSGARKVYAVELDRQLSSADYRRMLEGIELEDGMIAVDAVEYSMEDKTKVGVEIHSGRNRIVRRIFEALGYEVRSLDRVIFAELTKKKLPRGAWRVLTDKEVAFLKML